MRAACGKRVQPEPAASQFSKHSLLTNYALGPACGGLRRPAGVGMRSYVTNTKSADAVVPTVLDKTNACQRSNCAESGSGTTLSSFALPRQELEKMTLKLCLFKVRFSSPTLELNSDLRPGWKSAGQVMAPCRSTVASMLSKCDTNCRSMCVAVGARSSEPSQAPST